MKTPYTLHDEVSIVVRLGSGFWPLVQQAEQFFVVIGNKTNFLQTIL